MSSTTPRAVLTLITASLLATTALAQAPATAPGPEDSKIKTFATFPTAVATEEICQQADGSFYVTLLDEHKIDKVTPDGKVSEFVAAPNMVHLVGIGCGENQIAVVGLGKTFRGAPLPPPATGNALANWSDTDTHVLVYDLTGKQLADIPAPKGAGFNDFVYAGKGIYYAADSASGAVFSVDVPNKKIALWFSDPKFAPTAAVTTAANGVRFRNGWVYFTSGPLNGIYKVQVGADGKPQGAAVKVEEGIRIDNGDVANDDTFYFPAGTTLYKVSPTGEVTKFADPIQGAPTALVSSDGKWLYMPTRGGTAPQRLVRIAIP